MQHTHTWLIGAAGLYRGHPAGPWQQVGQYEYPVTCILRKGAQTVVGTVGGLWEIPPDGEMWVQLHDETLTEVLHVAAASDDPGLIAASPYGVAIPHLDDLGAPRWTSCSDDLSVNERYTNAVLPDPENPERWLVGAEAGVLVAEENGRRWLRTNLTGAPVRALCHAMDAFWAATDDRGVWRSKDGVFWQPAGRGLDGIPVFALAECNGRLLAGTLDGIAAGDGKGYWRRTGPRVTVTAVAADPSAPNVWLIGASPGGLWLTENSGEQWRKIEHHTTVRAIVPPES